MRFSLRTGSTALNTSAGTTSVPCTYHGWVMLPTPVITEDHAGGDGGVTAVPISYNKLVEMAKRVGVAQVEKAKARKPEKATAVINDGGIRVISKKQEAGDPPLLHAAISTVICTLVSKRSGIAVIVAHTWDGTGRRGIGCDVIKLKVKGCTSFKSAVQTAINELNRQNAEAAATLGGPAPPPYTKTDPNGRRARRRSSRASRGSLSWDAPPARRRLRSIDADNGDGEGGYMSVPAFMPSEYRHEELDEPLYDDDTTADHAYMDICGPAMQNHYMTVDPANMYMDVAPHDGTGTEDLYGCPVAF